MTTNYHTEQSYENTLIQLFQDMGRLSGLSGCQRFGSALEISNNVFEQGIPVLYDNGCIEALPLNNSASSTNGETFWFGMLLEPSKEQSIAIGFAPITIITHIEQNVKMLCEKLIENGKDCRFYFSIMWRTQIFQFLNNKLKGVTSTHRCLIFKRNKIMYAKACAEEEFTIRGITHLVWRSCINVAKREFNHSDTIVPVNPIAFHSSAMRFSAFRLISSERLKRARASSYVTFFASIIFIYLTFPLQKYG